MPGPVAAFFAENLIEAVGLATGVVDLSANLTDTRDVYGVPLAEPYVEIDDVRVSESEVVVGDRITLSGVLTVGLGHLIDRDVVFGDVRNTAAYGIRLQSSGGIEATLSQTVLGFTETPATGQLMTSEIGEVEGAGSGGYVITEYEHPTAPGYKRRVKLRKVCHEGAPVLRVPFEFVLQARAVGREKLELHAWAHGMVWEFGRDSSKREADPGGVVSVRVNEPFEIERHPRTRRVNHGDYFDASLTLTNRGFDEELHWKASFLDDDHRAGSVLSNRQRANYSAVINEWSERHIDFHPCVGEWTFVENAFEVGAWRIEELRVILEDSPDWTHTWSTHPMEIMCVRECTEEDHRIIDEIPIEQLGVFERHGARTFWRPRGQQREESGRDPDDELKPPRVPPSSVGLRCRVRTEFRIADGTLEGALQADGHHHPLEFDSDGNVVLESWPFDTYRANLTVTAPNHQKRVIEDVQQGSTVNVTLRGDTVGVRGRVTISDSSDEDELPMIRVVVQRIGATEDPDVRSTIAALDGRFTISGLQRGARYEIEAIPLSETVWERTSQNVHLEDEVTDLLLELHVDAGHAPSSVTLSGMVGDTEEGEREIVARKASDDERIGRTIVESSGKWTLSDVPGNEILYLELHRDDHIEARSQIFRSLRDFLPETISIDY